MAELSVPDFRDSNRTQNIDKILVADLSGFDLKNHLFTRLTAKSVRLMQVDFRYSIFDTCYLRDCVFDSCNFTGCRFVGSNFHGSKFTGCRFDYCVFERTLIDSDLLDTECPGQENLKMRFARTLRMNYQQVGDAKSANRAIEVELDATRSHLRKAWGSTESYYRHKYKGVTRAKVLFDWINFVILDWIWGNGESILKLIRSTFLVFAVMAVADVIASGNARDLKAYLGSLGAAPQIFLGVLSPKYYPASYLTMIAFIRLVTLGFFMSITIKRFKSASIEDNAYLRIWVSLPRGGFARFGYRPPMHR